MVACRAACDAALPPGLACRRPPRRARRPARAGWSPRPRTRAAPAPPGRSPGRRSARPRRPVCVPCLAARLALALRP
eukprot:2892772-Pleurochrysis_carterae.AAC.1